MFINETLKTQVKKEYDVIVCGGGFAGISAALASARMGKKTLLLEKMYMLGGLGTAGIVTIYLPLCDGFGRQVSFGIAEELLRLSISEGCEARYPENWLDGIGTRGENDKRFEVQFNPHIFAFKVEKLLLDADVDIIYGTYAVGVDKKDDKIAHIIVENKSGRYAYKTTSVVDATGDCDIALFSSAPTDTFEQGNILAAWYYSLGKDGYNLRVHGAADIPEEERKDSKEVTLLADRRFSGLDAEEISEMVCLSHMSTFNDIIKKRKTDETFIPVTITSMPQIRMTRKIIGEYVLSNDEMHKYFEDSIGMVSNWKKRGPVYEVPFRTLYSAKVKNLICAGRCTSTDQTLWDVMRVIPCCAVTGEAAGTAAAMTDDFTNLCVSDLQKILESNGVKLHEKDLL